MTNKKNLPGGFHCCFTRFPRFTPHFIPLLALRTLNNLHPSFIPFCTPYYVFTFFFPQANEMYIASNFIASLCLAIGEGVAHGRAN